MRPHDLRARIEALEHPRQSGLERDCAEANAVYRRLCAAMGIPVPDGVDPYELLCAEILGGPSIPADYGTRPADQEDNPDELSKNTGAEHTP